MSQSVFDQEITSSIFEEPTYDWRDRLKAFRAWFFSGIEVKMMILSYPTFFLAFYFILFRQDLMTSGFGWVPVALIILSFLFFLIGVVITSMQDWLINQYKGDGIAAVEFEIIYPDLSYGGTVFNVVKAERPFSEDPRSFQLLIQDYEQRQRQLKHGSASDTEIKMNVEGLPVANFLDDPVFLSTDFGAGLKAELAETWHTAYPDQQEIEEEGQADEKDDKKDKKKPAKKRDMGYTGVTDETDITKVQLKVSGKKGQFIKVPHPTRFNEEIQIPRLGDFRKYVNMPIFEKYMLDTGLLRPIFVKFKYAYDIGTILTQYMIILSLDGSQSLGDLFLSPLRYIQLEGVFGKSPAYHSLLGLIGVWRDIPIMIPMHTKKRTMAIFNATQRVQASMKPHSHHFTDEGICDAPITIMESDKPVTKTCGRSVQDIYMEIYSPTVPTPNEMVAVSNQMELSVARYYFYTAQNLRHQLFETNVLNANLLDAGTALDDMILETEGQIAKMAEVMKEKIPRWLFWVLLIGVVYFIGYYQFIKIDLPFLGSGGGGTPTNNTGG